MDLTKSYEFFQPEKLTGNIHIVGCGSVGSTIAENLVRCGIKNLILYDFDRVEDHNIVNQMFRQKDVGRLKVDALKDILVEINPDVETTIETHPEGWNGETMTGYIFLAVDSIELRKSIVEQHLYNPYVKAVFDVRTLLTGAQHFAADWKNLAMKTELLKSMQFSDEDAEDSTPVSACGITLGIVTTIRLVCGYAVNNFIKFTKGESLWKFVQFDGFAGTIDCF